MRIFAVAIGSTLSHHAADAAIVSGANLIARRLDDAFETSMSCEWTVAITTTELQHTRDEALMMPDEKGLIVDVAHERSMAGCSNPAVRIAGGASWR